MCNSVKKEHRASIEQFSRLEEHYQQQINLTSVFYDNLIDILEAMKRDHLEDLHHDRSKKHPTIPIAFLLRAHLGCPWMGVDNWPTTRWMPLVPCHFLRRLPTSCRVRST